MKSRQPVLLTSFAWRLLAGMVLLIWVCIVVGHIPPLEAPLDPQSRGRSIVFYANAAGNWDVFKMNVDGSNLTNLSNSDSDEYGPFWIHDGRQIMYSYYHGDSGIRIMDANGSNPVQFVSERYYSDKISWPSDHRQSALLTEFISQRGDSLPTHFPLLTYEGSPNLNQLSYLLTWVADIPAWSQRSEFDLHLAFADINHRLVGHYVAKLEPTATSWIARSPDGQHLALVEMSTSPTRLRNLYVMRPDGTALLRLSSIRLSEGVPVWSPDSQRLAFVTGEGDLTDISTIRIDGTEFTNLTGGRLKTANPDWSPDGKQLVFNGWVAGNWQIFSMNADGSNLVQLTHNPSDSMEPKWQP